MVLPAAIDLGGHRVVRSSAGNVGYADAYDADHGDDVLGISLGAAAVGDDVQVRVGGLITEPSWAWTPEEPIFVGAEGIPTQTAPLDAAFLLVVGFAVTSTSMRVRIESPIRASMKSRARYSANAEGGIVLNPKLSARLKAAVGPAE
ncbi:hypothetical protein [Stenotrophomonas sp. SY1]|uniref:hypothetical protein n=1 Tax=Stenotrophomonas sp. SY1 TaxID=477235 RepID=UPI001E3987F4|nr:hypothetical protein [Stenotrophomonas sp. SY1]MCD9087379.1 hypothetical protein [Stenotrophomonas sp. SY1]